MGEIDFRDSPSARATEELSQKSIPLVGRKRHSLGAGTFNHASAKVGCWVSRREGIGCRVSRGRGLLRWLSRKRNERGRQLRRPPQKGWCRHLSQALRTCAGGWGGSGGGSVVTRLSVLCS